MALVPVVAQIISRPFIFLSGAAWAVANVAVASAACLAIVVTTHFMKLGSPIVPHYVRRGLIRLYVVAFIPWTIWFGYDAYKANSAIRFETSQHKEYLRLLDYLDDHTETEFAQAHMRYARRELGLIASNWGDATTHDEILKRITKALETDRDRLATAIYALLAGVALPLLYPIFVWVLAGFRKSGPGRAAAHTEGLPLVQ